MSDASRIIHIGGGWYHIVVPGHPMRQARGRANADAMARRLEASPAPSAPPDAHSVYLRFIRPSLSD